MYLKRKRLQGVQQLNYNMIQALMVTIHSIYRIFPILFIYKIYIYIKREEGKRERERKTDRQRADIKNR